MNPYLKLIRPLTSFLGTLGVIVGALLAGITSLEIIILGAVVAFFAAAGGNAINDYFDIETDKVSKKHRPIVSGKVSKNNALIFTSLLFIIAAILATQIHYYAMILAFFNIAVAIVYSWKLKARPLIGNLFDSWLAASTFVFGGFLIGYFDMVIFSIFLMAFSANTAR
ncbi:MAG: UbiA family prenyltransferase, partial [Candidatus Aenigmarchaeota archaeon]|nr:UbiA family prenyltransferase [Candidatus Aenigmarchaeota archaeon]